MITAVAFLLFTFLTVVLYVAVRENKLTVRRFRSYAWPSGEVGYKWAGTWRCADLYLRWPPHVIVRSGTLWLGPMLLIARKHRPEASRG